MQNSRLLLLAIIGSVAGAVSFFIHPEKHAFEKYSILAVAALILMLFYFLTMKDVLKNENHDPQVRIFWIIVIICLPIIGDILYLIINDAIDNSQEKPKQSWGF